MQSYQWLSSVLEQRIENRDTYTLTNTNTNKTWVWSVNIFCAVKIYSWLILKDNDFYFSANWFGWFFVVWHCCVHFMSCRKTCHKNGGTSCQLILLGTALRESKRINLICLLRFCNLALGCAGNLFLTSLQQYFPTLRSKGMLDHVCLETTFKVLSSSRGGGGG